MKKIIVNLDYMLAKRKMKLIELSEKIGITQANLSILKQGKAKAIRFSTLESICEELDCEPGDILTVEEVEEEKLENNNFEKNKGCGCKNRKKYR